MSTSRGHRRLPTLDDRPATPAQLAASSAVSLALLAIGLIGALAGSAPVQSIGIGLFGVWGIGAAVMTLVGDCVRGMYVTLCLAIGLAVSIAGASLMIELSVWQPVAVGVIVAVLAAALHVRLLARYAQARRVV